MSRKGNVTYLNSGQDVIRMFIEERSIVFISHLDIIVVGLKLFQLHEHVKYLTK